MTFDTEEEKVLNHIDNHSEELAKLALDLGNCYTPPGSEKPGTEMVFNWLQNNGIDSFKQKVVDDRCNVVGFLGVDHGRSILFNSHLDVAGNPGEEARAWIEKNLVIGDGVVNDKGPMAAWLMAAKAIKDSQIELNGKIILTAVVGEIARAQIDEFTGSNYLGMGLGSSSLIDGGIVADYALVAETTGFAPAWAEAGDVWFKVTVKGERVYTPRLVRPKLIEESPNAVVRAAKLALAIEEWAPEYEKQNTFKFEGGTIVPKLSIGALSGGSKFAPTTTADECNLYLDVTLPPGEDYTPVLHKLINLTNQIGIKAEFVPYHYRKGYIGQNIDGFRNLLEEAHFRIFRERPGVVNSPETSMWRDINVFNGIGIPSITYGPSRTTHNSNGTRYGAIRMQDLVSAAKVYADLALRICAT